MQANPKQLSGGAKLRLAGKKAILLGVLPEQLQILKSAAEIEMRPVTQFVTFHALEAARVATSIFKEELPDHGPNAKAPARRSYQNPADKKKKPTGGAKKRNRDRAKKSK